ACRWERLFGAKVFLETWVRVREGWSDDEAALKEIGAKSRLQMGASVRGQGVPGDLGAGA
ncbi:hypothetical protein C7E25_24935, partial [Stenotrophomonas maltophilia]